MRTLCKLALLVTATCTIFGCAHNYYSVPQETLEKKVKIIGIAPFFTDADSDIGHPEKQAVTGLIQSFNAKNQKELIERLRATGIFYAVRQVEGDPARLFASVLAYRERRDDAGIIYNKYFFERDQLKQLLSENGLDAIVLVTVSGLTRPGKVYASNYLSYLQTDFNYLVLSAQMLDGDGSTLWEYPNFRQNSLSYSMFLPLQYPDFDEAAANQSEKVDVKFKTVAGVRAALAKSEPSKVDKGRQVSVPYADQFDEMLSLLKTYQPLFGTKKDVAAPTAALPLPAPPVPSGQSVAQTPVTAPSIIAPATPDTATSARASAPVQPAPATVPAPVTAPNPAIESGAMPSGDIVPEVRPGK